MRSRPRFRVSESWSLEDRIALSHAGAVAEVAALPTLVPGLSAIFHGKVTSRSVLARAPGDRAVLTGTSQVPGVGVLKLSGILADNPVLGPLTPTEGALTLSPKQGSGTVTLGLTGPFVYLTLTDRTSTNLAFTVVNGTGPFASFVGRQGIATLNLSAASYPILQRGNVVTAYGRFSLALTLA